MFRLKAKTLAWIIVIVFILKHSLKNLNIVEHIGAGVEAQLSSHSNNSLMVGTGEPLAANAYTSLESTSVSNNSNQSRHQQPNQQPNHNPKDIEIERLRYMLYQQQLQYNQLKYRQRLQQDEQSSLIDKLLKFLFG